MGALSPLVTDLVAKFIEALRGLGVTPTRVVLFGSYARGTETAWSDIDILVVSPAFEEMPAHERPRVLARANRALRAPIQALWATPATLASAPPASFLAHVAHEGIDLAVPVR